MILSPPLQDNPQGRAFGPEFRAEFHDLMRWRRDVRRFRTTPVPDETLARCLTAFRHAPSVGLCEPWRLVWAETPAIRAKIQQNFHAANEQALSGYDGDKAKIYAGLKLAGLQEAPLQFALFCDQTTEKGAGLGAATMPETRAYSCVSALMLFWLALRAEGLGLGWVSILDPARLSADFQVDAGWQFIGYFCLGWPEHDDDTPELERAGWEKRADALISARR
ncbi:5,6-dimethylbenzimidazole synthase [Neogemmobacter tilapiae]|uniref:5,6-dimethylbenzimidazole synthase n=1 Tax=Neogemmobacter tilapiae TaxID=875041 RepID=A0A918TXE3_9RHOB|nr:5,6-dimethylbenzimidazole synthase [Gemmobacter tilapiae]GHC63234.1 5,6-dimethylbenzimidazole synthase [Gemmobacter tilapiae]